MEFDVGGFIAQADNESADEIRRRSLAPEVDRLRSAILDSAGLDLIEDPEPLIGNEFLYLDSINWVVGKPGSYKSFVVLDWAGCVACGETWNGMEVDQGRVVYLVAEGVRGTKKRVRAWEKALGKPMTGVSFLPLAVQTTNSRSWGAFVELCREIGPKLIILDTQARITVGVNENDNREVGEFVQRAEELRTATGACIIIVHHIGRDGVTGRGASAMDGALSTIIRVAKDDGTAKIDCLKSKDGEEWQEIEMRAMPMGDSIILAPVAPDGYGAGGAKLTPTSRKLASDWWATFGSDWTTTNGLVDSEVGSKASVNRAVQVFEKLGMIGVDRADKRSRKYSMKFDPCGQDQGRDPGPHPLRGGESLSL